MKKHLTLYAFLLFLFGIACYLFGVVIALPRRFLLDGFINLEHINQWIVWYSGMPTFFGLLLLSVDLLFLKKTDERVVGYQAVEEDEMLTVVLTAYNDELSIGEAVKDFKNHPRVKRVIVISNNSKDKTIENAEEAGAIAHNETLQGYGACVYRSLSEGLLYTDTKYTLLCEGDRTFRAYDIDKFLAYIPHADIVNGTRIVEQLRNGGTQLTNFMYYGNFFAGKLLELKYIEKGTLTDMGTTYKLCRNEALKKLLPLLSPKVNLEFNPYLLDRALSNDLVVVECPITFHQRVGESKGGNISNFVALNLGLRMIWGIVFGWKRFE